MGQHTPGPWSVEEDDRVDGCRFIPIETEISSGPKSRLICEVQPNYCEKGGALSETDRANARLIAAAPDLLAALEVALPRLAHKAACHSVRPASEWAEHGSASFEGCDCEVKVVSAAIAKATGAA